MELTSTQNSRLEAAIVRHIRDIPWDEEIPNEQWLTGLEINDCVLHGSCYIIWYSFEVYRQGRKYMPDGWELRTGQIRFTAHFVQDVVEDIRILD
jgi:hypothetical protein